MLEFAAAVIATGGTAMVPPLPGLADSSYLTNDTFYNQTELPRRFAVIGSGPIGASCRLTDSCENRWPPKLHLLADLASMGTCVWIQPACWQFCHVRGFRKARPQCQVAMLCMRAPPLAQMAT